MKLHSVFVTYNRLELTKIAIESYLETVSVPFTYMIVDNASTDGTQEWLIEEDYPAVFLDENRFPGYAANQGWDRAPAEMDVLHRADNDFRFLPGWCDALADALADPRVGQVGLRTNEEELFAEWNVGGNCAIRRSLWDAGLRYDERPWGHPDIPKGWTEDSLLSPAVKEMGFEWTRVTRPCIVPTSTEDPNDAYYRRTWELRGIRPPARARRGGR
jgi:glycosyltransferase involved in cell wall biosynthesis